MTKRGTATKATKAFATKTDTKAAYHGDNFYRNKRPVKRVRREEKEDSEEENVLIKADPEETALVYPYQYVIGKRKMIKVEPGHEGKVSVITASPDETFMTVSKSVEVGGADWKGAYPMWKDTKSILLAGDSERCTHLIMIMPGEDESHRTISRGVAVHKPNLDACVIVDKFRSPSFLGGDIANAICGTVYIVEQAHDDDIDYDEIEDGKTQLPLVDIADDFVEQILGYFADDSDDDEE